MHLGRLFRLGLVAGAAVFFAAEASAQSGFSSPSDALKRKFPGIARATAAADTGGKVRVIVVLKPVTEGWAKAKGTRERLARLKGETRSVQDRVVGTLLKIPATAESGRGVRRFATFPMLALPVDAAELETLARDAAVEAIQLDEAVDPVLDTSTVITGAKTAWSAGADGTGYAVAVLDSGVQIDHPFLAGKIVDQACFSGAGKTSNSLCPNLQTSQIGAGAAAACSLTVSSSCYHGTHVSGIAVGRRDANTTPKAGVARAGSLIPVQVFSKAGKGKISAYFSDIIAGLEWVNDGQVGGSFTGVTVASVNMSLGGGLYTTNCDAAQPAVKAAIDALKTNGIATVIAAGNEGVTGQVSSPGCISTAVTVSSTTKQDARSSFSNLGTLTDLYATGSEIYSSILDSKYGNASGTSMAAPHVAGAFAAIRTIAPDATVDTIEAALKSTGTPIVSGAITKPRIRIDLAAAQLGATLPPASLSVTPDEDFSVTVKANGKLSATAKTYALATSSGTVSYTANGGSSALPNWVSVSPTSGTAGTTASNLTVSINKKAAAALAKGTYSASVVVTNTTNGNGNTTLTVIVERK